MLCVLRSLDAKDGAGSEGIPPIKSCAEVLSFPLQKIFNRSVDDGVFPDQWKEVLIIPVHKSGHSHIISKYRPVSVVAIFGKVLEKL